MFHVDNNSAVPVMPAVKPVVSAVTSFFTEGGNGVPPTYPGPDWFNIIQSELLAILAAAGISPDKASNVQLLAAMRVLFLDASQNGADIQDKAAFLQNLQLGEAAKVSLGVDQTWQDMTSSRSIGVVYTNTTGKPIQLLLDFVRPSASWSVNVRINGVAINGAGGYCPVIPNNATYQVITTGISSLSWRELR